jgi:hypothetical protein
MRHDDEFDAWLTGRLQDEALPDHGFTARVTARLETYQRRRRLALTSAAVLAGAIIAIGLALAPAPLLSSASLNAESVMATLLLAAACSLAWIGTESGIGVRRRTDR